jgi:hypothetical protein
MSNTSWQDATEFTLWAQAVCGKFSRFIPQKPTFLRKMQQGRFCVVQLGFAETGLELRALLFRTSDDDAWVMVQINLLAQPIASSFRQIRHTASYEELRQTYAGTKVQVLSERQFSEFMRAYDSLGECLQALLDGHDSTTTRGTERRRAA